MWSMSEKKIILPGDIVNEASFIYLLSDTLFNGTINNENQIF